MRFMEIITYIAATLAGLILILGESSANGAPQEAAIAALAAAMTIIPYAITATIQKRVLIEKIADHAAAISAQR